MSRTIKWTVGGYENFTNSIKELVFFVRALWFTQEITRPALDDGASHNLHVMIELLGADDLATSSDSCPPHSKEETERNCIFAANRFHLRAF